MSSRFGSFFLGMLLGSIVGSAATLLLTPDSGEGIRNQLIEYKNQLQREMQEASSQRRLELELELARLRAGSRQNPDITIQ